MTNKNFTILILFMILVIFSSCKKKEIITHNYINEKDIDKKIECQIEFPDTVYLNKEYDGVVKYKSILDTITTSFDDKKKKRYPIFYLTIVDKPELDYRHLKKMAKIFGAHDNREIPFYDIKFEKTGTYYIDGIINDYVVIDINKRNERGEELVREIENEERVTKKVIVVSERKNKSQ